MGRAREQEEDEKYVALGEMDVSVAGGSGGEGLELRELADGDGDGALLNGVGENPRRGQQFEDEWDESKDNGLRGVSPSDMDEASGAEEGRGEAVRAGGGTAAAVARGGDFARLVHEVTWRNRSTMVRVCFLVCCVLGRAPE